MKLLKLTKNVQAMKIICNQYSSTYFFIISIPLLTFCNTTCAMATKPISSCHVFEKIRTFSMTPFKILITYIYHSFSFYCVFCISRLISFCMHYTSISFWWMFQNCNLFFKDCGHKLNQGYHWYSSICCCKLPSFGKRFLWITSILHKPRKCKNVLLQISSRRFLWNKKIVIMYAVSIKQIKPYYLRPE